MRKTHKMCEDWSLAGRGFFPHYVPCVSWSTHFDTYMSYRWHESFNTVNRQIRDVITMGTDMCGCRMQKGGGDGPYIHRGAD